MLKILTDHQIGLIEQRNLRAFKPSYIQNEQPVAFLPIEFKHKFIRQFIRQYDGDYMIVAYKKLAKTVKNQLVQLDLWEHTVCFDH